MEVKDIVAKEVARQAAFGYEPSWEDFVIAGQQAGQREVVEFLVKEGEHGLLANLDKLVAKYGKPYLKR